MEVSRPFGTWLTARHRVGISGERPGVGGSTFSVTLAVLLAAEGRRVGLLGTDTRPPIVPNMLGASRPDAPVAPVERYGVRVASLAWLRTEEERFERRPPDAGRLAGRAFRLDWGGLDLLLVDLPPEPDEAAALGAAFQLESVALVATPRGALEGATRAAIQRLRRRDARVLGVIENMTYYCCPSCGREEQADGAGAAKQAAESAGVPWLGATPISIGLRDAMADGRPGPASDWTAADAAAFGAVAQKFMKRVSERGDSIAGPETHDAAPSCCSEGLRKDRR